MKLARKDAALLLAAILAGFTLTWLADKFIIQPYFTPDYKTLTQEELRALESTPGIP